MITYNVPIDAQRMTIGVQGENAVRQFLFDISEWRDVTGEAAGAADMIVQRPGDKSPYAATITMADEDTVSWVPVGVDTAKAGVGKVQLRWYSGGQIVKNRILDIKVDPALDYQLPDDSLDPWASWMPDVINAAAAMNDLPGTVAEATADWLGEHIEPTTPAVDDSLSVSGAAADAKAAGDAIDAVKADMEKTIGATLGAGMTIEQGGLKDDGTEAPSTDSSHYKRLRSSAKFALEPGKVYGIVLNGVGKTLLYSVSFYNDGADAAKRTTYTSWASPSTGFTCPATAKYGRITIKSDPETNITPATVAYCNVFNTSDSVVGLFPEVKEMAVRASGSYVEIQDDLNWMKGSIRTGSEYTYYKGTLFYSGYPNRLVTAELLELNDAKVTGNGYIAVHAYNADSVYLGGNGAWVPKVTRAEMLALFPTAKYMRVIFKRADDSNTALSDVQTYGIVVYGDRASVRDEAETYRSGNPVDVVLEPLGLGDEGLDWISPLRVRNPAYIPVESGASYEINVKSASSKGILVAVSFYDANDFTTDRLSAPGWSYAGEYGFTVPAGATCIRFTCKFTDNSNILPADVASCTMKRIRGVGDNFVVGTDLIKRGVDISLLGSLTYAQAFCRYDGKWYSTDGSHIAEQDADFAVLRNEAIDLGHGNSLQLGSDGKAYASGWNDNKIYVVDLATLTVTDTITLPTTGYTTAAVDDVNQIAYIFQRTSYPETEESYNFLVYDYANDSILLTRKTAPFAAMQACDYCGGRIVVVNGLGTAACPNGYRIYNTAGDVVAEYRIGYLATQEPEGICIDRETFDLYVSQWAGNWVYRITQD